MKFSLLLALTINLIYFSCAPEIIDNKRAVVTGEIKNSNGEAIANIPVRMSSSSYILGYGISDEMGKFEFVSLVSSENISEVYINSTVNDDVYTKSKYVFSMDSLKSEYDVGSIILEKKANLEFSIENTSGISTIINWRLDYNLPQCDYYDDPEIENLGDFCYPLSSINGELNAASNSFQTDIKTIADRPAIFSYELEDGSTESIEIQLNPGNNTYHFEF